MMETITSIVLLVLGFAVAPVEALLALGYDLLARCDLLVVTEASDTISVGTCVCRHPFQTRASGSNNHTELVVRNPAAVELMNIDVEARWSFK